MNSLNSSSGFFSFMASFFCGQLECSDREPTFARPDIASGNSGKPIANDLFWASWTDDGHAWSPGFELDDIAHGKRGLLDIGHGSAYYWEHDRNGHI
jgi:hypothetical protein